MLATPSQVRELMPSLTGEGDDAVLTTLIIRFDRLAAARCGYPSASPGASPTMESRTYTLDLAGDDGREVDLTVYPASSVVSASVDYAGDFEGEEETVAAADMTIRDGRTVRLSSTSTSAWCRGQGTNRVTFVAGYNGASTVTGAHSSSVTTITVASTARFATSRTGGGRVVVGAEVITFAAKTATTLTGCTRGAEGTTAASILTGAAISQPTPDELLQIVCQAVRYWYDLRQTQGVDSITQAGVTTTFQDVTRAMGVRDFLPDFILAGLGFFTLPRALV